MLVDIYLSLLGWINELLFEQDAIFMTLNLCLRIIEGEFWTDLTHEPKLHYQMKINFL